ncbi:serine aminopeptidase domain-containing protein [Pararobbsia silviterrae]|uniref:Alpha/beta hydrolase n=1 Tax=Pararobbsia silviterrae TaxID=1792498 RepID=A0A494XA69_9BURK|nr:alpha/beta hydrolase [Pararobbsia silviterrae]RKP45326.1 alpha/beta hydrolase [Pararobbsia silviterrae]
MNPIVFDGCLGWLHDAPGTRGVVLCNPLGHEAMWAHKSLRRLACQLARNGMPTLRFDYHGTGDSAGADSDAARLEMWIGNIVAATRKLRETTGVRDVVLVGLRFGATLAALASQVLQGDESLAGLVLLAPAVSGRTYLREMKALYKNWRAVVDVDDEPGQGEAFQDVLGHRFYRETLDPISSISLNGTSSRPAPRVLILDPFGREGERLAARYIELGADVELRPFPEYADLMVEAIYSADPRAAFDDVALWLQQNVPEHHAAARIESLPARIFAQDARETPLRIDGVDGTDERELFGVLCEPVSTVRRGPLVVIVNTGANLHTGDGRLAVVFARRLAAQGVASVRLDISGIGETPSSGWVDSQSPLYSARAIGDVCEATRWLSSHGFPSIALFGICSGAYLSLHAAAMSPHVDGVLAVNVQRFIWGADETLEQAMSKQGQSMQLYMRSARKLNKWVNVLRGRSHVRAKLKTIAHRFARRGAIATANLAHDLTRLEFGRSGRAQALVSHLNRKGVEVRLVYGSFNRGLEELSTYFGQGGRRLERYDHIEVARIDKLDHSLVSRTGREKVFAYAEQFFAEFDGVPQHADRDASAWRAGERAKFAL